MALEEVLEALERDRDRSLGILFRLLRQPSISAHGVGVEVCAALVADILRDAGARVAVMPTPGHPVVFAEVRAESEDAPTILFYGHYDVQPPEPLEEWHSPPFEPTVRDGRIYARGAGDNKGQFIAHVLAVRAYLEAVGSVPLNVKLVLEGEEESGSPHLHEFVDANRDLLETDLVLTADGGYHDSGRPVVCFGVRGLLAFQLEARGAASDVHSGNRGNLVPNPAWELVDLLSSMRDESGRVLVDGFYDDVREPSSTDLDLAARLPFDRQGFLRALGLRDTPIEDAADYARRVMFEPTFNIAGFTSGYGGPGFKTIVPARAVLKMDVRLVVDQRPDDVFAKVSAHVEAHNPRITIRHMGAMEPSRTSPDLDFSRRVIECVRAARGIDPVIVPSLGGSLPDSVWTRNLGVPSILVPYANPDENNHAPNENLELEAFFAGIRTSVRIIDGLSRAGSARAGSSL